MSTETLPAMTHEMKKDQSLPTPEQIQTFLDRGYAVDDMGRPMHPWTDRYDNEGRLLAEGRGAYRHWGPNFTADPIIVTDEPRPRILMIQRADNMLWALPGGFVDPDEAPLTTAAREVTEETRLVFDFSAAQTIYQGVVDDYRATKHAWPETYAYMLRVDQPSWPTDEELAALLNEGEIVGLDWKYIDELPSELHGSHKQLIDMAFTPEKTSIRDILKKPHEELDVTIIDAGHMAYDHQFISDGAHRLFIKSHDPSRFTDAAREAHSRAYLEKEFALYTHLSQQGFTALPDRFDLVDDRILAMDALHESDGWLWRAPTGELFDAYVRDVLSSLSHLERTAHPVKPAYHDKIEKTYTTLWREGWDDISDASVDEISSKIRQLSANWDDAQIEAGETLIAALPQLRKRAQTISRDQELFMAHNDARQSNIAWHPDHGARFVDWSWGDRAPKHADATMFLIDLAKAGHDVSAFKDSISADHALTLIGFWLAHSLWQTRDGSLTVREHQVASASTAHKLLNDL